MPPYLVSYLLIGFFCITAISWALLARTRFRSFVESLFPLRSVAIGIYVFLLIGMILYPPFRGYGSWARVVSGGRLTNQEIPPAQKPYFEQRLFGELPRFLIYSRHNTTNVHVGPATEVEGRGTYKCKEYTYTIDWLFLALEILTVTAVFVPLLIMSGKLLSEPEEECDAG